MSPSLSSFSPSRQRQVAAAALAGDDNAVSVDAQFLRIGVDPLQARDTVVETGRIGRDFRRRRSANRVAEIDHGHRDALGCNHPAPGAVVAVVAGHRRHPAAVNVVDAGQDLAVRRPDELDVDRIAVGRGGEPLGADTQTCGRRDHFRIHGIQERLHALGPGGRRIGGFFRENLLAARDARRRRKFERGEHCLDTGIDPRI